MRRFFSLERYLHSKNQFSEFDVVMNEYFKEAHAELIPLEDLEKSPSEVFYLPMHAVKNESSTSSKV